MYVQGFIVPVPGDKKDEYRKVAQKFANIMKDHGLIEVVEAWEADVPDGEHTDFRKAVKIEEGEKVVFSWVIWPDKETCEAAHNSMMSEEFAEEIGKDMPFDGKRMIYGGFEPLVVYGRD